MMTSTKGDHRVYQIAIVVGYGSSQSAVWKDDWDESEIHAREDTGFGHASGTTIL
jgi:hypothetical protein